MAQHTIKGFITASRGYKDKTIVGFQTRKPSAEYEAEKVVIREHEFTVEVEDTDLRPSLVKSLEEQKRKMRAEFACKVKEIDDQIGRLLALENGVEA